GYHGVVVHYLGAGLVHDAHSGTHGGDGGGVYHVVRALGVGDVQADIIAGAEDLVQTIHMYDVPGEAPGALDGHVGVVAPDGHAELQGEVRHQRPDGAEADDAQVLAAELRAGEG